MDKNGFIIDLNRISKKEFRAYLAGREQAEDKDIYDAEQLYVHVIMKWPFPQPVSVEGYQNLGLLDAMKVDETVGEALTQLSQKKSGV